MASTMDAICSFIVSVWRQALDTITRIMGAVSYAPLMVVRQLEGRQFISVTTGLTVTPQIRDVIGQRQTYTYAFEALTY